MIAEYLLTNWNVSVIGISDLDIILDLKFRILSWFSEKQIILSEPERVYFDATLGCPIVSLQTSLKCLYTTLLPKFKILPNRGV